jgi:hypothetical protein
MVAGLSGLKYSAPSTSAANARAQSAALGDADWKDLYAFGQDVFGQPSNTVRTGQDAAARKEQESWQ